MNVRRVEPGPGQESVWDCPWPPGVEDVGKRVKVVFGGVTLAYTGRARRIVEAGCPPAYHIPPEDVCMEYLPSSGHASRCEWKGRARYYDLSTDERSERNAAWCYPEPTPPFAGIEDYVSFYPSRMDACWVDGKKVEAQKSALYGGWVTPEVVGPFRDAPGAGGG